MEQGIKKEPIGCGKIIYTSKEFRYGTDGVLLADFAKVRESSIICDIGCGSGILSYLILRDTTNCKVYGADIQPEAIRLAVLGAKENGFDNFFGVLGKASELKNKLPAGKFSLVVTNPPYKSEGAGIPNPNLSRKIARHESGDTLGEFVSAAKVLLKSGGRLCMCHRPERLADIFLTFRQNKIEPKILRTVHQRPSKEPWLVLIEGKKDAKPGLKIMPPLYIEDEDGKESKEIIKIYRPIRGQGDK